MKTAPEYLQSWMLQGKVNATTSKFLPSESDQRVLQLNEDVLIDLKAKLPDPTHPDHGKLCYLGQWITSLASYFDCIEETLIQTAVPQTSLITNIDLWGTEGENSL